MLFLGNNNECSERIQPLLVQCMCMFCLAVRAVHLEEAQSLDPTSCINAKIYQ